MSVLLYHVEMIDANSWVAENVCIDEITIERSWMSTRSYEDETDDERRKTKDQRRRTGDEADIYGLRLHCEITGLRKKNGTVTVSAKSNLAM